MAPVEERIWHELKRIADSQERIATALESFLPEPETLEPETLECPHPMESRIDFGVMEQGTPEWECRICGFRTPTPS